MGEKSLLRVDIVVQEGHPRGLGADGDNHIVLRALHRHTVLLPSRGLQTLGQGGGCNKQPKNSLG